MNTRIAWLAGVSVALIGGLTLIGWYAGLGVLTFWQSSSIPMAPTAAVLCVFVAMALMAATRRQRTLERAMALLTMSAGLVLLTLRLSGQSLAVERLGLSIDHLIHGVPVGFISPLSAGAFVLAGMALLLHAAPTRSRPVAPAGVIALGVTIGIGGFVFLLTTLFGTPLLAGTRVIPPALNTSLAVVMIGVGLTALGVDARATANDWRPRWPRALSVVFVLIAVFLSVGGYGYYRQEEHELREQVGVEINNVALMEADSVSRWRALLIAQSATIIRSAPELDLDDATVRQRLLDDSRFDEALVVTRSWLVPRVPSMRSPALSVFATGEPVFLDLDVDRDTPPYIALLLPIRHGPAESTSRVLALRSSVAKPLSAVTGTWPLLGSPRTTIRRQGAAAPADGVAPDAALRLRTTAELHTSRSIAGSPWEVVVTASPDAMYSALWTRLFWVVTFVGMSLLLSGSSLALVWRHQRAAHYREQARLSKRLQEQSASMARLVRHSTTILYTLRNSGGRLVAVELSENLERLLGYTASEALEPGWWVAHLHHEDRNAAVTAFATLATQDVLVHEYRFLRRDGSVLWVRDQITVTAREGNLPLEAQGSWNDITEQREADRQLRESEASARLKAAALEAAANAIVITDRNGRVEWVNSAFSALTGYSAEEAIGHNQRDLVRSGAQDVAFYEQMWDAILAGRVWEGELTNRRKDGTTYREAQTITPVRDAFGTITHFIGVKRDLTKERALQAQFLQAQKMEVVGRLAGGVAHDFNNLLTVINGESELAIDQLPADSPHRETFGRILEAGERAARLTAQLLAFSRHHRSSRTVFGATAEITQLAPMLRRLVGEDISLTVSAAPDAAPDLVSMDRGHLEQVLLNLVVNARDAMPSGGAITIVVAAPSDDTHVRIAVSDTGCGIPADLLPQLFEPFFTTKPSGKGTGLGLATVHSIVSEAGGTVTVESAVGVGTTFTVTLPRSTEAATTSDVDAPCAARGRETIVLVEDDAPVRELATRMLRSHGYAVIPMESARAALTWFAHDHRPVQLLLTDVVMPDLTGPELVAALPRERQALPVLYMSGYSDERLGAHAWATMDDLVAKPFTSVALTSAVRRALDHATVH